MSEVDKHLSLPSLCGYRLEIGYFRVAKGAGESYPSFPSEFGGHGPSLCFWTSLREGIFGSVGQPVWKTAASSPPWSYTDARVCTVLNLVWFGDFKIQFCVLYSGIPGACLPDVFPLHRLS
jgi:hypothetical protein